MIWLAYTAIILALIAIVLSLIAVQLVRERNALIKSENQKLYKELHDFVLDKIKDQVKKEITGQLVVDALAEFATERRKENEI